MATGKRVAEEAQLLAEERWIVDALKKIRTVRNGLQIERLQLESLLTVNKNGPMANSAGNEGESTALSNIASTELDGPQLLTICNTSYVDTNMLNTTLDNGVCNFEELNLTVTNPVYNLKNVLDINTEYEEDDDDMEEESDTEENINIDMNMFMNSQQQ